MIKANNSYLIFGIPCDQYGMPSREVTNDEINEKYLKKLFQIYLKYDELALIEKEKEEKIRQLKAKGIIDENEINKIVETYKRSNEMKIKRELLRKKDNEFFETMCSNKSISESIVLLEFLIENHDFLQQNGNFKEVFEFYKKAFCSINSMEKREKYDEILEEENNSQFMEFAERNKIDLIEKEIVDDDLLYLSIHRDLSASKQYDLLYNNDECILLINERLFAMTAIQKEKLSDIKRSAVLKRKELNEYALLLKQDKVWRNYKFISGKQTEKIFKGNMSDANKNHYFKLLVTALKNMIITERHMMGFFKPNQEGQFEEVKDMKLFEKVEEYNGQKNSVKGELDKWAR